MFKRFKFYILGFIAGILNGFFGAGGGLVVVPMLEKLKIEPKKAHATSIAIILPLCIISAIIYLIKGIALQIPNLLILTAGGIAGAIGGSFLLMKINNKLIKRIFAIVMIISSIRILFKAG